MTDPQQNSAIQPPGGDDILVLGLQWGDEGKGRIVDRLAGDAGLVVRFNGGANAGHTVVAEGRRWRLSLLPSGVVRGRPGLLGPGVLLDAQALLDEIDALAAQGIAVGPAQLRVADEAALVLPVHRAVERVREARLREPIGSTQRGIGPAAEDRAGRRALRVGDLRDPLRLEQRLAELLDHHNTWLRAAGAPEETLRGTLAGLQALAPRLLPYAGAAGEAIDAARASGAPLLLEGAQAVMLDLDWGAYPFVTASSTAAGLAALGGGLWPVRRPQVLGVCKAYATRVGAGPLPTELHGAEGDLLRERGGEYGTNTGRPRRCGWLDAVQLRHACRVAGADALALTKLDVLDGLPEVRIAVAYRQDGRRLDRLPADAAAQSRLEPVYETLPGWQAPTHGLRDVGALPPAARAFVRRVAELAGRPVRWVSTGAERDDLIDLGV
ncbi:adenylosuccinate synthase [Xylophilus sp.]|uniref:adenylosuccinate synthase n=1 Tax=Xylophilus sp. TaxID=2653893 RepID=UPI0013B8C532|nr:adenylosuccinate synthase [Xylophilus sp.]KAF1047755.1 MAG: Adenylosuccinate synthetase [Xylophilus sp.]